MGVTNCSGNVMYKAAGRAFLVNGGAGNSVTHNLIVNGAVGVYNQHADDITRNLPLYDSKQLKRGDKGDYVWRAQQALGVTAFEDMFTTTLAKRFPAFARLLSVNSTTAGWASPAKSDFRNNVFLNNSVGNICLRTSFHAPHAQFCDAQLPRPGQPTFIDQRGSVEAQWAWFPQATTTLEFVNTSLGFDTRSMGLRCDEWRKALPVASLYRPWVKHRFEGVPSSAPGPYTPAAAAVRAGLRSGAALTQDFVRPCAKGVARRDCRAIWVAWGGCERGGTQIMRYTIERGAAGGGAPCEHEDGVVQKRTCVD